MREIQWKEAKATLSAVLDAALLGQQFAITRDGRKDVVVISWDACKRLSNVPSFGQLLASATRRHCGTRGFERLAGHRCHRNRMLPFDFAAATAAGTLSDNARGGGQAPGFADVAIAATSKVHGLTILTRDIRHFAPIGVAALDPFETLPPLPDGAMAS